MTATVHPQRIVIPIIAGLGNSLMTMPMVRQIKRAWPDSKITILARSNAFAEMFRRMSEVDEVMVAGLTFSSPPNLLKRLRLRLSDLRGFARMTRWTRQRKPDLYLVPFPSNRWHYSILSLLSGAKQRALHSYPVGRWKALHCIGTRIPAEPGVHDVLQNLRLLKLIGIEPDESESPRFQVTPSDRARADELLTEVTAQRDTGVPPVRESEVDQSVSHPGAPSAGETPASHRAPADFIAVHAGSGGYTVIAKAKRWDPKKYAQLIEAMMREHNKPVVLLEGPDESGVADSIVQHLPDQSGGSLLPGSASLRILKLTGPLGEAAAVLERASLYVGSDSGLAHLAAAVGKRAVTIFAPADPDRVCPYGSRDLVVQTPNTCSPCFTYPFKTPYTDSKCREPYCIEQVTVDQVLAAVRRGLSGARALPLASPAVT